MRIERAASAALEPLLLLLKDPETPVRNNAVESLGKIGRPALKTLALALDDPDSEVRVIALKHLKRITGVNLGENREAWLEWIEKQK